MGTVSPEDPAGVQTRLRAGAIAAEVYKTHPNHPGAAHYMLHAYDDPQNAPIALEAARRYADIAPEAPHALHMPSHIFLQLGMWPETAASNEASWAASDKWVKAKGAVHSQRDYHSLHWLLYAYLQQGQYGEAERALHLMQKSLAEGPKDDQFFMGYGTFIYASMASAFVVETERWDMAQKLFETTTKQSHLVIPRRQARPLPISGAVYSGAGNFHAWSGGGAAGFGGGAAKHWTNYKRWGGKPARECCPVSVSLCRRCRRF